MKKVLVISDVPIYPLDAGNSMRIFSIINNMKKLNVDVHFLFVERHKAADMEKMTEYIGKDKLFVFNFKKNRNIRYLIKELLRRILKRLRLSKKIIIPYYIDEIYPKALSGYVKELHRINKFDVIWTEYVWYSKVLKSIDKNTIKVIDTHDVFTDREKLFLNNGEEPNWYYTTKYQEAKGLSRADYVVAIQNKEREFFEKIVKRKTKVVTIGNYIKNKEIHVVNNKKYIFVGSNNKLNIYYANYFIKNIFPIIKQKEPDSEFLLVGRVSEQVPDSSEYTKIGYVDNLDDIYANARLVINPIKAGTGLNIKTIEALGNCKPLVTTTCGAKGLDTKVEQICKIADNDEEFAGAIIQILNDDKLAEELSKNAYNFVLKYNVNVKEKLNDIINKK